MIDLSIIIVSWNAKKYLVECLQSIRATAQGLAYEVVVVDNASSDGSPEAVKQDFPGVWLIETGANLGFARANNLGVGRARGRYCAFVNSDVVVLPGCFQALLAFMDAHPEVGLAGPRLLNSDRTFQPSCRAFPTLGRHLARALFLNRSLADASYQGNTARPVEVLAGSFWIARREAVEAVGKLDEQFFFYAEDLDWCRRFRQGGWSVVFFPGAQSIHYGGGSSSGEPTRFSLEWQKASLQLWRKHYGRVITAAYLVITLLHNLLRLGLYVGVRCTRPGKKALANQKVEQHWKAVQWVFSPSEWARPRPAMSTSPEATLETGS